MTCECGCKKPERLKEKPEKCTPGQIEECHGKEECHPCEESKQKS